MHPTIGPVLPGAFRALCAVLEIETGKFARALGISRNTLRRIATGKTRLTEAHQEAAMAFLGATPEELEAAVSLATLMAENRKDAQAGHVPPGAKSRRGRFAKAFDAAVRDTRALLETKLRGIEAEEAREEAAGLWQELATWPQRERILFVETRDEFLTPAFIARLCDESEKAAARKASEAVELADLALKVAGRAPGTEAQRAGRLGYSWAFVGNAGRVSNKLGEADAAFASSCELCLLGYGEEPEFFDPARPLDLEASLRRNQGRFGEALILLERALQICWPSSRPRILLKQAATLEQEGEPEKALAALDEAHPAIERGEGDPRFRRVLRFNVIKNLLHLERPGEAAALLPELKALSVDTDNDLDKLRLRWLEAVVQAGLGQRDEALAELGAVRREFSRQNLPGDSAIAGLYEAQVLLGDGRNAEVRTLTREMRPIFDTLGLELEALAAVRLFLEAVERDAATVALAREAARCICRLPRRA
ncbi:MAG TPA: helix-turn-helix domain-containing protein [Thermoanaerobaculia bacterium]|jgi:tetratricopeptide (TPR) repeat protein|nr:helix-turn-helix domain-containing protein [Thermoanaerobaculia bacterium]